ncbi:ATP-binding cassette domain-containing protein [Enhydrobacter sp.]|uniref:ABC transporter ATP-binding protein n=1 Tax=Enhydrobacter sp. TaxID=1894999 RepID=UPI00261B2339|nr:ATP-binding cassette domain-containing protein [Enhydrobacter sp.]WIM10118.1 MAG: branched-chain amino acid transport ATP-binding protein LivG [Enhydrobacter sp.]
MSPAAPPLLRVEGLTVRYGALTALKDMSWQVSAGEILGIIGPNGAGKSSCFAAVTHAVPRLGDVWLAGERVTDLPTFRLARLGLRRTFQQNAFFGELSILENAMAAILREHSTSLSRSILLPWREAATRQAAERAAAELLTSFGIEAADHAKRPADIAYGTQRLLSVVLAYGAGAQALLIDEPAAGTGGPDMQRLADLLVELRRRRVAVVVIEHHMDLIMAVADRIVVIEQGRKLAEGTPADIQRNEAVLEAYLGRAA